MIKKVFASLSILVSFTCLNCFSQKILYPVTSDRQIRFDNFNMEKGKPGPATSCIMQDSKGFIWCGTETGLYRFDGINYVGYPYNRGDSGLVGVMVQSIFEDSENNIWAGTYGGLNKIDPLFRKILHLLPDSTDFASPDNIIRYVDEDKKGLLWLITDRHVFSFNRKSGTFTRFTTDSLAWRKGYPVFVCEASRFLEDSSGRIWIATDNGLYMYKDKWSKIFPSDSDLNGCRVNCVNEDSNGNIWCGTEDMGLIKITDPEKSSYEEISHTELPGNSSRNKRVTAIYPDEAGYIWIFRDDVLTRYKPVTGESIHYYFSDARDTDRKWQKNLRINRIFRGKDNSLWLVDLLSGLIFRFIPDQERLFLYYVPIYTDLTCIQDITGNFWIGCIANNMYRLVADSLPYYLESIKNGGFANSCRKTRIAVGDSGNIWFAFTGGVFRIRESGIGRGGSPERFEIPGMDARASSILRDRNGNLWIGYNNGIVVRYNPAENFFTKFRLPEKYNEDNQPDIIVIQEDKSGNIWLATQTDGIFRLAPGKDRIEKFITLEELHGSKYISSLLDFIIDSNGELWIATFRGLFRVRQDDMKITNYTGFDNTGKTYLNNYLRIHEDQNRNIWILNCLEGPYLFNRENETFLKVKIPALQPSLGFDDMLFDRRGKIWLARYDRLTVIDTLTNSVKDFFLPICGFDVQSLCLKSGTRLFIINSGLFIFIDDIPLNREIPPVYITSIFINNIQNNALFQDSAAVTELTKIDLKSGQNNIRIDYAALNYNQPELNRYRYFMSGLDEDTTEAGTIMRTEYRQMPPGHYKFWVTGSNNDGIWNPVGTSFEIRIHPPWYRSTVACFVYLISFIFMLTGILRFRTYSLRKEKVRLESEVKARTADLEIKNRQLAETDRIKTHFFTDISHEIRTPLSLISGPLDILSREGYHDERESDMIEMMKRNVNRLVQMVNQLLDISRLDAGKMRIMLSEGDLIKFLRILIFEFLSLAESKQIKYIAEMPDEEFITWFDRDKTEKIISNLLTNAFKFTPQGGTVKCRIEINYDESKKLRRVLKFIVTDSGKGISREYIHKIFNRFFREDESGETEGTGIGLSLAKEFVCLLHGNIQVTSESGQGSEFTVFIPLGKEHLAPDEYIIVKTEEQEKKTILHKPVFNNLPGENITHESRVNILLIEDNTDLRNFLQMNLSDKYNILCAENGKTGLHTALTMMPDLIVTDIMMPDLDGISLCYQLKNNELTSHIPIILLTAKSTLTDKIEGIRSGADDYIIKPFNTDELKARISNLLLLREKLKQKYGNYNKLSKIDEQIISVDDKFLNKVVMIINENLSDFDFNVEVLHEKIGMSRMHLNRKLKILTGMPPGLIIRNMRLEKAAELLMHRAGNITEIANSVGISNPSYFTKAFRIYFGVSPKEYSKYNI